ncbi:hypothetical protein IWW36_001796 [Coemansia brasiliensis]|uniref:Complex 1 LYR protein domain-containing protein n=1 Tax=Coemansia brasiliensis TaxID=2650707 RepID=A0A9W8I8F2_9FUNG|nr:hypothetical protein IWW36_001796 [Coemansia brasiliensis]
MFRNKVPFFRTASHRGQILSEYRRLLRQAKQFADPVEQTYLWSWIRERFHSNKRQTAPKKVELQRSDGVWASIIMADALNGIDSQKQLINDLAYGRTGYLKMVAQKINEFYHPTKICQAIRDVRPRSSRIHQPKRAYWIPLDLRAFSVPQHLLDRIAEYDEQDRQRQIKRRERREQRLAREIQSMTKAINNGNDALYESGLLPEAFTSTPEVAQSPAAIPGVSGNILWTPKIKNYNRDPPVVQHIRTSSGFELYKVNGRKPPHWLAVKIAASFRKLVRRVNLHEFYFHIIDDLRMEEEFEAQLGISDPGYWIYASNYRDYLRGKIKETSGISNIDAWNAFLAKNDEMNEQDIEFEEAEDE